MARFDGDEDDLEFGAPRIPERASNAGMIGFILALVSLGLLGVVCVLWYAMSVENQQQENAERVRLMLWWFTFLVISSFFISVAATILAARGLSPANPLHRGWSLAALVLGIIEILITGLLGFSLSCCVGVMELMRHGGG
jgi:hypothetical protein